MTKKQRNVQRKDVQRKNVKQKINIDNSKYGFKDPLTFIYKSKKGLSEEIVREISRQKNEPDWMLQKRLQALKFFYEKEMPTFGGDLSQIDFDAITYYIRPSEKSETSWNDVPKRIKKTFDRLGIPQAERKFLAGVGAQYESEVIYHSLQKRWTKLGVVFCDMSEASVKYPELVKKYFGSVIPSNDNKFSALNTAVWSGGSFIYVPKGVHIEMPLQAYFRINAPSMGQFERTLIIVDEGASVHYIEGCLPAGELVSLGDTFIPIEEVTPGMKAVNSHGLEDEVVSMRKRSYSGDMLKIVPVSKGNSFELTPEHPIWAIPRDKVSRKRSNRPLSQWDIFQEKIFATEPDWIPAGEIRVGDLLCFPVPQKTNDLSEISDDLLELLGYYLAEGSCFYNKQTKAPNVVFSFNMKERVFIDHVKDLIFKITSKKAGEITMEEKNSTTVYVYSESLLNTCEKYCGRFSDKKKLHKDIMELPPKRQKLLFDTYLRGDGSRHKRKNGHVLVRSTTVSKILVYQLQEILARNGIYGGIIVRPAFSERMRTGRVISHKEAYTLHYEEGLQTHQVWFDKQRSCFWVPIREIHKRDYSGFVYNIEMSKAPNAYLAKGFAVHNCTAPTYSKDSLHAAVVELVALKGAKVRYTTIQNWSNNVYNLVTKRAVAYADALVEWVDGNLGSKLTMKYPAVILKEPGAKADILSIAFAGRGQHQDAGAKAIHLAPNTSSKIVSKSISKDGGRTSYRGLVKVTPSANNCKIKVRCDALLLDTKSRSDTYPTMDIDNNTVSVEHEATVSKLSADQLFYLQSRGFSEEQAERMIVAGFLEVFTRELPLEYAVELNRLIEMEMEGSVG